MANLPQISPKSAQLPERYSRARQELSECSRVDECKDWADKAAALASYARQSEDTELEKMAQRIRARAIRRAGELLREIEPARGANQNIRAGGDRKVTRKQAAADAGMSDRQQKTALRVANVPEDDFDRAVESESPPTMVALAERGTNKRKPLIDIGDRDPDDVQRATGAIGMIRRMLEFASENEPNRVARGMLSHETQRICDSVGPIVDWLTELKEVLDGNAG